MPDTPPSKTPAWPVDLDLVMRKLRLRNMAPTSCLTALARGLRDAGYPVSVVSRAARNLTHGYQDKRSSAQPKSLVREKTVHALKLGNEILTIDLHASWEAALRAVHEDYDQTETHGRRRTTELFSREIALAETALISGDEEEEYGEQNLQNLGRARKQIGALLRELLPAGPPPAQAPPSAAPSVEAQVQSHLLAILRDGRSSRGEEDQTAMQVLGINLAAMLTAKGLPMAAMAYQECVAEGKLLVEREEVYLQAPSGAPLFLQGGRSEGHLRFITPETGSKPQDYVGQFVRALPPPPGPIGAYAASLLESVVTLLTEQHLQAEISGAEPRSADRLRM